MGVKRNYAKIERLHELLEYSCDTGVFYWKAREVKSYHDKAFNTQFAGNEAGEITPNGYRYIKIDGKRIAASRIAIAMTTGEFPEEVDHVNGVRTDNRISNLRIADRSHNLANKKVQRNNVLNAKGVHVHKQTGKYRAQIRKDGRTIHIGLFCSLEDAKEAYLSAAQSLYGDFAFGGDR